MERVCFAGRVRAERLDEYRQRHETVWPDMLAALREAGWGNYSLFLAQDGLLIGYLETDNYQAALDAWRRPTSISDGRRRWRRTSPTPTAGPAKLRTGGSSGSRRSSTWIDLDGSSQEQQDVQLNWKWR